MDERCSVRQLGFECLVRRRLGGHAGPHGKSLLFWTEALVRDTRPGASGVCPAPPRSPLHWPPSWPCESTLDSPSSCDSAADGANQDVSIRITQLLAACSDSQRTYLASISAYRGSLKEVLEREATLRTVVRDREILVGRLIKLGNKKPSDSAVETHQAKLEDSQRELAACECTSALSNFHVHCLTTPGSVPA